MLRKKPLTLAVRAALGLGTVAIAFALFAQEAPTGYSARSSLPDRAFSGRRGDVQPRSAS